MADEAGLLRKRVMRLLARREHSRAELRRKLAAPEVDEAELERVLDEFQGQGWLSEERLAEQMIHAACGRYGSRRIAERLRQKGVGEETLAQAASAMAAQEFDNCMTAWRKRFGVLPATLEERAKQSRFLAGRGFSSEVIRRVLSIEGSDDD